ncbi:MAG: MFS transporter, partial [Pirellulales bacterium]|nr:MFS transporter [Pirellulales bacterium]
MSESSSSISFWRTPLFVLLAAAAIVFTSFGIRQSFGLFMNPISSDMGWGREVLSFALATQNLMIGIAAPVAGAIADRWGAPRTVALGGIVFAAGILVMSLASSPLGMFAGAGLMAGAGLGACGLPLILTVVGQVAPPEKRSLWLGIATATATGGQLAVVPFSHVLLSDFDWMFALMALSIMAGLIVPMAYSMRGAITEETGKDTAIGLADAVREAFGHRGFILLTAGFYVCGFQVSFIAVHLPAYLTDQGASAAMGATALMLIAFFNMIGSWGSGWMGGLWAKKYLLSGIYLGRSAVILAFLLVPVSGFSAIAFAAAIGFLWLATVPLTSGLVAQIFGTRHMSMLYGVVFASHQVGSFFGAWLGGYYFDTLGSYDVVWWISIVLGLLAALIHWPIADQPVGRLRG